MSFLNAFCTFYFSIINLLRTIYKWQSINSCSRFRQYCTRKIYICTYIEKYCNDKTGSHLHMYIVIDAKWQYSSIVDSKLNYKSVWSDHSRGKHLKNILKNRFFEKLFLRWDFWKKSIFYRFFSQTRGKVKFFHW